ncbi:hypothetical protein ABIC27_002287 [Streptomyces sp. PvR034]
MHRRAVQVAPSANLAALGVVPASVLLNSGLPCDTTYLDGARDPNLVLTRLRAAASTRGPLLVYLSGRLTADRRGRRLHLALAATTPGSVRYTALPWEWLGTELRDRPPGSTTVLLDLVADKAAWPLLQEYAGLPVSPSVEVYGVVSPPGFAGSGNTVSGYTRCWIDQLASSPGRPANLQLHALALGAAALPPGTVVLPTARELAAPAPAPAQPCAPVVGGGGPGPPPPPPAGGGGGGGRGAGAPQPPPGPPPPPPPAPPPGAGPPPPPRGGGRAPPPPPRPGRRAPARSGRGIRGRTSTRWRPPAGTPRPPPSHRPGRSTSSSGRGTGRRRRPGGWRSAPTWPEWRGPSGPRPGCGPAPG